MSQEATPQGFSTEDTSSIAAVLSMLENEARRLGAASRIAGVWSDWADLLRPTAEAMVR